MFMTALPLAALFLAGMVMLAAMNKYFGNSDFSYGCSFIK